jgi:tRNA/tmRNA/rRNA uracil-C5-methylase (TrmA/RlmC/RlmD family)
MLSATFAYGGYGNLSLPLAKHYSKIKIECVEWSHKSVEEGMQFSELQNLKNLRFINSDVKSYLERLNINPESFVVLDPPREGCEPSVIKELTAKSPKCIVYISCDPMTWGRDTQLLFNEAKQKGIKYRIATIHGLDMFPQTDHIEVFSVFEREGRSFEF